MIERVNEQCITIHLSLSHQAMRSPALRMITSANKTIDFLRHAASSITPKTTRIVVMFWLFAVLESSIFLTSYQLRSDQPGVVASWPSASKIKRTHDSEHLLLFIHPKCVCSHATIDQLKQVLPLSPNDCQFSVAVYCPDGKSQSWLETRLADTIADLKPDEIRLAVDGYEAQQFGVTTSGHLLHFDNNGSLKFSGGITSSRGHRGDCIALKSLKKTLSRKSVHHSQLVTFPVFGCTIRSQATNGI